MCFKQYGHAGSAGEIRKMVYTYISPDCAVAMDSNPCYKASNVKQTEAQEAVATSPSLLSFKRNLKDYLSV